MCGRFDIITRTWRPPGWLSDSFTSQKSLAEYLRRCAAAAQPSQTTAFMCVVVSNYNTYQYTHTKIRENASLMHIKMWDTSLHLDARLALNIQLWQRRIVFPLEVYDENSFILGLVGDQLKAAECNLSWAAIRDVWIKPQFEAEPRLPVNTRSDRAS